MLLKSPLYLLLSFYGFSQSLVVQSSFFKSAVEIHSAEIQISAAEFVFVEKHRIP